MKFETEFDVGDEVFIIDEKLNGIIVQVDFSIDEEKTMDFTYSVNDTNGDLGNYEAEDLRRIHPLPPKQTLYEALIDGKESKFTCLKNIKRILDTGEELDKALTVLKESLHLGVGESFSDDFLTVSKAERTTHSYKGQKEHDDAVASIKKIEDMLKLQKKTKTTTTSVITVKKK
jgi:hypothetical protein